MKLDGRRIRRLYYFLSYCPPPSSDQCYCFWIPIPMILFPLLLFHHSLLWLLGSVSCNTIHPDICKYTTAEKGKILCDEQLDLSSPNVVDCVTILSDFRAIFCCHCTKMIKWHGGWIDERMDECMWILVLEFRQE